MNIKRFFGKSSKEALNMVRKALGDDAVILSNRTINGGNEIMAFREEEIDALINENTNDDVYDENSDHQNAFGVPQKPHASEFYQDEEASDFVQNTAFFQKADMTSHTHFDDAHKQDHEFKMHADMARFAKRIPQESLDKPDFTPEKKRFAEPEFLHKTTNNLHESTHEQSQQNTAEMAAMLKEMREMRNQIESQLTEIKQAELRAAQPLLNAKERHQPINREPTKQAPQKTQQSPQMLAMLNEMRAMRSVFESKLTSLTWNNIQRQNPIKSNVLSMLLGAGFSASLSRQLAEKLPETFNNKKMDGKLAKIWIKNILALNLNVIANESELFDQGGIFALIGPTGVGKTTTTAKLAARYVMKHGTQNLGIITTDGYRIGGHEQLRIYGKILGVMVHAVKDETDLKIALNELKNKHMILIDTVGVSQRDRMVSEQIAMLSNTNRPIKKLLCMNATSTGETLTDVLRAYQGNGLDGCIMTKIDEAATLGNALDVIIRHKLKLYYATNGQRVPEDILIASKVALIEQAFKQNAANQWPYQFLDEELPFIMGNSIAKKAETTRELGYV